MKINKNGQHGTVVSDIDKSVSNIAAVFEVWWTKYGRINVMSLFLVTDEVIHGPIGK